MSDDAWLSIGENRAEWDRLLDQTGLADFFQLWPVQVVDPGIEAAFVEAITASIPNAEVLGVGALLDRIAADGTWWTRLGDVSRWVLHAAGTAPEEIARLAAVLNQRRDVIREALGGPLIWALHPLDWQVVRHEAVDLWSVHVDVIRFIGEALKAPPPFPVRAPVVRAELPRVAGAPARASVAREELRRAFDGPLHEGRQRGGVSDMEQIVRLALEGGLIGPERRALLLRGLPLGFVYSLPAISRPIDQLRFDLMEMERTPRLIGLDGPPLAVWLANAAEVAWPSPEAYAFMVLRARLLDGRPLGERPVETDRSLWSTLVTVVSLLDDHCDAAVAMLRSALEDTDDLGTRACLSLDLAVAVTHAGAMPSAIRDAMHTARSHVAHLGDLRLMVRYHSRAAWVHGHMGDRRSGLAEVTEGRRIASLLALAAGDDRVLELETVARWLEDAPR